MGSVYSGARYCEVGILNNYISLAGVKKLGAEFVDDPKEKITLLVFLHIDQLNYAIYSIGYEEPDEIQVYANQLSSEMVILGSPFKVATLKEIKDKGKNIFVITSKGNSSFLIGRVHETKMKETQTLDCIVLDTLFV